MTGEQFCKWSKRQKNKQDKAKYKRQWEKVLKVMEKKIKLETLATILWRADFMEDKKRN